MHSHRCQMARRVCASFLQVLGPHQAEQLQEEPTDRTTSQQIRGEQGRVAHLADEKTPQLGRKAMQTMRLRRLSG